MLSLVFVEGLLSFACQGFGSLRPEVGGPLTKMLYTYLRVLRGVLGCRGCFPPRAPYCWTGKLSFCWVWKLGVVSIGFFRTFLWLWYSFPPLFLCLERLASSFGYVLCLP